MLGSARSALLCKRFSSATIGVGIGQ
ncbi:hypothetical protein CCUS01_07425 [Colletotrichum cuscutae]|uniref:Uncharacterized protein n=1 Tax=Colletotrichum cuscutae TaxID=1209917 RepID=A0AAI9Y0C9_9PEZI|nr:hypothetical protein CCUS01_07425 [Colletotrichum cuscutae]